MRKKKMAPKTTARPTLMKSSDENTLPRPTAENHI